MSKGSERANNKAFLQSMWPAHPVFGWSFTFQKPPIVDLDVALYGAGQCQAHISLPAWRRTWGTAPPVLVSP